MIPVWKLALASPKDIADAIAAEYFATNCRAAVDFGLTSFSCNSLWSPSNQIEWRYKAQLKVLMAIQPNSYHQQTQMSDPLSITAGIVGIIVPALHGTRLLLDDLQQLKEVPKTVKRLLEDVHSVDIALKLLQGVEDGEWDLLGPGIAEESKTTISSCTQACDLFRTDLQRWTKHSDDGKLVWQDRAKVGFFKQGQIKAMSEQLSNCKLTINSVVSIATL